MMPDDLTSTRCQEDAIFHVFMRACRRHAALVVVKNVGLDLCYEPISVCSRIEQSMSMCFYSNGSKIWQDNQPRNVYKLMYGDNMQSMNLECTRVYRVYG